MPLDPLRIELLGELRCLRDDRVTYSGGGRRSAVLAILALAAPRAVSVDGLIDGIWGEDPPQTAVNAIQVHVSHLRRSLGAQIIERSGSGYRLDADVVVDVREFTARCRLGADLLRGGDADEAVSALRSALELWRGPALADFVAEPFAAAHLVQLDELRWAALEDRLEAELLLGRHAQVISELQSYVEQQPLRERMRACLMRALYRTGRQSEALAVYEEGRRIVADELGLDPSPELRQLHHDILTEREARVIEVVSTLGRSQVPQPVDQLVGRTSELADLRQLLTDTRARLVSILGPGGVGKTRLATELAHQVTGVFRDGVVFVALSQATTPADVAATMCAAVGVRQGENAEASLRTALGDLEVLVVCDNFEHVIEAAPLIHLLLSSSPGLRVVATSRRPLDLPGEHHLPLAPLEVTSTAPGSPLAVQLFVLRVQALDPTFKPTDQELGDIGYIVGRCDGLPLAVELAAARTRVLSVSDLRERLDSPLQVLASTARGLPERQRTMRANIAWSVEALTPTQQHVLCSCSVFRGGFTLQAAGAVSGLGDDDIIAGMEALLDLSLVQRGIGEDGHVRFDLLETIREYAEELLGHSGVRAARRIHARHYRDWLHRDAAAVRGLYSVQEWLALLAEAANIREAIRWSLDFGEPELAADLIIRCAPDWQGLGSPAEFQGWLARLLELPDLPPARRFDTYRCLAWAVADTDPRLMEGPLQSAREVAGAIHDPRLLAELARAIATQQLYLGRPDEAAAAIAECEELAGRQPDNIVLRLDLLELQADLAGQNEAPSGSDYLEQALAIAERYGAEMRRSNLLYNYCEHLIAQDRAAEAVALASEGVELSLRSKARGALADHLSQRGYARHLLGEADAAYVDLRGACEGHLNLGKTLFALDTLLRLAATVAAARPALAATALAVIDRSPEWASEPGADRTRERFLSDLSERMGDDYDAAVQRGMTLVRNRGSLGAVAAVLAMLDA